jgi:hypothetical protein
LTTPRRVSVIYNAQTDEEHGTSGIITNLEIQ